MDLSMARHDGGPIPLTEIVAYLTLYPSDDPTAFCRRIRVLDQTFLTWHAKKQQKAKANRGP